MTIAATYVSTATFTVDGNHAGRVETGKTVNDYPKGLRVKIYLDPDPVEANVNSAIYQPLEDPPNTLVSIDAAVLDETLTEVELGSVYEDEDTESANMPPSWEKPWAVLDNATENTALKSLAVMLASFDGILIVKDGVVTALDLTALQFIRKNATNTAFEAVPLALELFSDFEFTDPSEGQVLAFDSALNITNQTIESGGGGGGGDSWTTFYQGMVTVQ